MTPRRAGASEKSAALQAVAARLEPALSAGGVNRLVSRLGQLASATLAAPASAKGVTGEARVKRGVERRLYVEVGAN